LDFECDQVGGGCNGEREGRDVMTGLLPEKEFSRKQFLKGGGALVVGFSLAGASVAAKTARSGDVPLGGPWTTPASTALDSWISIGQDGSVTVFTGSIDTGQGKLT